MRFTHHLTAVASLAGLAGLVGAQPVINSLGAGTLPRSGRLVIKGSGFGAGGAGSRVEVDGLPAWHTTWSAGRIVAFVPEGAGVGVDAVRVVVGGEQSNELPLEVTLRHSDGRVRWTFEADSDNQWFRPALAPDGTVYLHTSQGFVYALAPDGALKWTASALWYPYVPPSAGPDGTLYCGSIQTIFAISPSGETLWTYRDQSAQGMQNAMTVGPDGNLHGAYDFGPGAISLTTGGSFRWSNVGSPMMFEYGASGNRTIFGPSQSGGPIDRVYIGMDLQGNNHLYAFDLAGHQKWAAPVGPNSRGAEPTIGSDGTVYTPDFIATGYGWVIQALDPGSGQTEWFYDGDFISGCSNLAIGPDDTLYYVRDLGHLEALDTRTRSRRWHTFTGDILDRPTITPDGTTLVMSGLPTFGQPGFIRAYGTADGAMLWEVPLPGEAYPGKRYLGVDSARITPDGATAYFSTVTLSGPSDDPSSIFYAIDLTNGSCAADFNGDGTVNTLDMLAFLNAWTAGDNRADWNQDGSINTLDVLSFLNAWGAGC